MLVATAVVAALSAAPTRADTFGSWCSALAYLLDGTPRGSVTVTVTCSGTVRELRISIPSARGLAGATALGASTRRPCRITAGRTAVCRLRLPAEEGVAITAVAVPAARIGRSVVFHAFFANGTQTTLRLTITGPPGDDG